MFYSDIVYQWKAVLDVLAQIATGSNFLQRVVIILLRVVDIIQLLVCSTKCSNQQAINWRLHCNASCWLYSTTCCGKYGMIGSCLQRAV